MNKRPTFDEFLEEHGIKEEIEQIAKDELLRLNNRPWYIKLRDRLRR